MRHEAEACPERASWFVLLPGTAAFSWRVDRQVMGPPHGFRDQFSLFQTLEGESQNYLAEVLITSLGQGGGVADSR